VTELALAFAVAACAAAAVALVLVWRGRQLREEVAGLEDAIEKLGIVLGLQLAPVLKKLSDRVERLVEKED
jgi:hypothetical protein